MPMYNRLSRVFWAMGQALLPAHLRTMEGALLADSALRYSQQELPAYGVSKLAWNEALLSEGVLSFEQLVLLMPSGLLLKFKENAQCGTFNFNTAGSTRTPVYIHVRNFPEDIALRDAGRQVVKFDNIDCWLWTLELSAEQEHPDTRESFRLAEFEKQPDGLWRLSVCYIPPLISIGQSPFLKDELTMLARKLEAYHYHLTQEIAAIYLSGSDLIHAKQCLRSVVQLQRFLGNMFLQIKPHPYTLYEQLKHFYVDLCFYHNVELNEGNCLYRHEQLAEVFQETLGLVNRELQFGQVRSPYLPFKVNGGMVRADLPEAVRDAREIYLLVQKNSAVRAANLNGLKLAAASRVQIVHKFYLQGIPFKLIERPPFQHSFGPEVDIYQLVAGDEWDYALHELVVAFLEEPQLEQEKFFLYWR